MQLNGIFSVATQKSTELEKLKTNIFENKREKNTFQIRKKLIPLSMKNIANKSNFFAEPKLEFWKFQLFNCLQSPIEEGPQLRPPMLFGN